MNMLDRLATRKPGMEKPMGGMAGADMPPPAQPAPEPTQSGMPQSGDKGLLGRLLRGSAGLLPRMGGLNPLGRRRKPKEQGVANIERSTQDRLAGLSAGNRQQAIAEIRQLRNPQVAQPVLYQGPEQ